MRDPLGTKPSMNLLIVGATGGTGQQVVTQALERGHQVTALVRRPRRAEPRHGLTPAVGDVLDPASLDRAMPGQEAVLSALGHNRWLGPTHILSEGTRNLIAAMGRHGVRRLICGPPRHLGFLVADGPLLHPLRRPVILPSISGTSSAGRCSGSDLDWTIVRRASHQRAEARASTVTASGRALAPDRAYLRAYGRIYARSTDGSQHVRTTVGRPTSMDIEARYVLRLAIGYWRT